MARQTQVLTDVENQVWHDSIPFSKPEGTGWSIEKRRLAGGVSDGVDVIDLNNGKLSLSILPTRGMGIWKGTLGNIPLGWNSPVRQPVHPSFVNLQEHGGIGWLNGFNEWICRCGLAFHGPPVDDGGSQLTLHGKIANTPAHYVEVSFDEEMNELEVKGIVDEAGLFLSNLRLTTRLITQVDSATFTIIDEVQNLGSQPAELELLYHTNNGPPFLEEGAHFKAAIKEISPRDPRAAEGLADWTDYSKPEPGYAEQAYFMRLLADENDKSTVLLRNKESDLGLKMRVNSGSLPCFTLWKCTQAEEDGYVTGLEPGTDFPNARPFEREQGRLVNLQPSEIYQTELSISVLDTIDAVSDVAEQISALQATAEPKIHLTPYLTMTPG